MLRSEISKTTITFKRFELERGGEGNEPHWALLRKGKLFSTKYGSRALSCGMSKKFPRSKFSWDNYQKMVQKADFWRFRYKNTKFFEKF